MKTEKIYVMETVDDPTVTVSWNFLDQVVQRTLAKHMEMSSDEYARALAFMEGPYANNGNNFDDDACREDHKFVEELCYKLERMVDEEMGYSLLDGHDWPPETERPNWLGDYINQQYYFQGEKRDTPTQKLLEKYFECTY